MVTIKQAQGIAERLAKAEALVAEGAVLPVAGLPCKHILAAQLALGSAPQPPAPVADPVTPELVERGVKLLVTAA